MRHSNDVLKMWLRSSGRDDESSIAVGLWDDLATEVEGGSGLRIV